MKARKSIASVVLLPWVATLIFLSGPVRWELANTTGHLLGGLGDNLPLLTRHLTLPVLGVSHSGAGDVVTAALVWLYVWAGLIWLFVLIWRARDRESLTERLVFGFLFYFGSVFFIGALSLTGALLPFALMSAGP